MNGPDVQQNNNNNLLCGCCDDALLQPVSLFLEVFPGLMVSEQVLLNLEQGKWSIFILGSEKIFC